MKVVLKCNPKITYDEAGNDGIFTPSELVTLTQFSNMTQLCADKFTIAAAGSLALPFGSVTDPHGFYIEADNDFDLTIGDHDPFQFRKSTSTATTIAAGSEKVFALMQIVNFASLLIASPTGSTAALNGRFAIWGLTAVIL